jgi:hypothetical protein
MRRAAWLLSLILLSLLIVAVLSFAGLSTSSGGLGGAAAPADDTGIVFAQARAGEAVRGGPRAMDGMLPHHACAVALSLSRSPLVFAGGDLYQVYAGMLARLDHSLNVVKVVELPGLMPAAGQEAPVHAFGALFMPSLAADSSGVYVTAGGTVYKYDRSLKLVSQRQLPMPGDDRLSAMCPMAMMMGGGTGGWAGGARSGAMGGGVPDE